MNTKDLLDEINTLEDLYDDKNPHVYFQEPAMLIDFLSHIIKKNIDYSTLQEWSLAIRAYLKRTLEHGFRSAQNRSDL